MTDSHIIETQNEILLTIKSKDNKKYSLLDDYYAQYGEDEFYVGCVQILCMEEAPISIISFSEEIEDNIKPLYYLNYKKVVFEEKDTIDEFVEFILNDDSKYLFFYDESFVYDSKILQALKRTIEINTISNIAMTLCNFVDDDGTIIANPRANWVKGFEEVNRIVDGKQLFNLCKEKNPDILLGLKIALYDTDHIKALLEKMNLNKSLSAKEYLGTFLKDICEESIIQVSDIVLAGKTLKKNINSNQLVEVEDQQKIDKKITLFWNDKGEYYNLLPIGEEASKRGYEVVTTSNPKEQAEIGIYCAHFNYPENSKFSVILLHDMAQGHNRWPNIWELEKWNIYDLGVVPGEDWGERWSKCGFLDYANPKYGVYQMGYPKSDLIDSQSLKDRATELKDKMKLPYKKSILYAPSWEYLDKEDDFVRAIQSLPVNLLIKQAHWPNCPVEKFVSEMRNLHEGKYNNVFYIEPEESIMTALEMCDLIVSDESSVMAEGLMFNKPSLAVTDWMIPDCNPPRYASVPMDYVIRCKKVELREMVEKWLEGSLDTSKVIEFGKRIFGNRGKVCSNIMDAIEYYSGINKNVPKTFMNHKLEPDFDRIINLFE